MQKPFKILITFSANYELNNLIKRFRQNEEYICLVSRAECQ